MSCRKPTGVRSAATPEQPRARVTGLPNTMMAPTCVTRTRFQPAPGDSTIRTLTRTGPQWPLAASGCNHYNATATVTGLPPTGRTPWSCGDRSWCRFGIGGKDLFEVDR
jgi:hypothetical protein